MKVYLIISIFFLFCNIETYSQDYRLLRKQNSELQIKLTVLENEYRKNNAIIEDLRKQQNLLDRQIEINQKTNEKHWNHFSLISTLILGVIGLLLPLVGFFSISRIFTKVSKLDQKYVEFENQINNLLLSTNETIKEFRFEALSNIAESATTLEYIYRRLPRHADFDNLNHFRSSLKFNLKSIWFNSRLLFETGEEDDRQSIINSIAGCNSTFNTLKSYVKENDNYLLDDFCRSYRKYNFEFIHDLRKYFTNPGHATVLNEFEQNLRFFRLYAYVPAT